MFLQLSVLPISTSRCPKDMHIFREPGSWKVPTRNCRNPRPEHAWYKWLNVSIISKIILPEEEIPISGMIKWKRPYAHLLGIFKKLVSLRVTDPPCVTHCHHSGKNCWKNSPFPRNSSLSGNQEARLGGSNMKQSWIQFTTNHIDWINFIQRNIMQQNWCSGRFAQ